MWWKKVCVDAVDVVLMLYVHGVVVSFNGVESGCFGLPFFLFADVVKFSFGDWFSGFNDICSLL